MYCHILIGILRHTRHFISAMERFFECRKEIGYALTTLPNRLKKLVPFFFNQSEENFKLAHVIVCVRSLVINLVLNWFYDTCLKTAQTD